MSKSILQIISSCSVQKTAAKNTKYSRYESILKIGHHACKGYSPCKILTLAQKLKFQKNMSKSFLQIISSCSVQKTAPKNNQYSRYESLLRMGHHACKGYSPCKILTLAQKLKFQKTCQNPFYKSFRVVLCKKPLQKNTKYSRYESILKIGHHACKGYSPCKILTFAQKLKFQKPCQNPFFKSFRIVLCKKPLEKTLNIREITAFWKSAIMHAKAIAHAKSSLWLKN